jgi:uncharacterized protein YutE (UPF0331/DUF86 family)
MVDRERASALIEIVRAALGDLDRYADTVSADRLQRERDTQNMVLHAVYAAAQGCIDLAMHIVADEGLRSAATYREAFESLRDARWIPEDLCTELCGWAGLRNVIAHGYVHLDLDLVRAALGERGQLERLVALVAARVVSLPPQA